MMATPPRNFSKPYYESYVERRRYNREPDRDLIVYHKPARRRHEPMPEPIFEPIIEPMPEPRQYLPELAPEEMELRRAVQPPPLSAYQAPPPNYDLDHIEIIPCPDCDNNGDPRFMDAMRDFLKHADYDPDEEHT